MKQPSAPACETDVETLTDQWPRDFNFEASCAEQQELLVPFTESAQPICGADRDE